MFVKLIRFSSAKAKFVRVEWPWPQTSIPVYCERPASEDVVVTKCAPFGQVGLFCRTCPVSPGVWTDSRGKSSDVYHTIGR